MKEKKESTNFIHRIIEKNSSQKIIMRFPPEPNGYLHIGHSKSIFLNFGTAEKYSGVCNLRFDDTNPLKESKEYIDAIKENLDWLGFKGKYKIFYTSDYFQKLYEYAVVLIKKGKAFVCDLNEEEIRKKRGTLTEKGEDSPYRNRSIDENLKLFELMKKGEVPEGKSVLRAKIDMASPNINLRDPVIYRIRKIPHHKTANKWCIYPLYDFAHCISDSIENVTHSLCSLEFENNRPLYDWFLKTLSIFHSKQIEFARLNLTYTILSKRKLIKIIESDFIKEWSDPRMPTISGMKRRGYTKEAIENFCERIGVAKRDSVVDIEFLEHCVREDLNKKAKRVMGVLDPIKVTIENYPEDKTEKLTAKNHPQDESIGKREITFSKELYIERSDFMETPKKKFFRLAPDKEVRFRYAYFLKCKDFIKDEKTGEIKEIICTYDPITKGGKNPPDGRKVKGTIHWVSAKDCIDAEIRLYDRLFIDKNPLNKENDFIKNLNPNSLKVIKKAKLEKSLLEAKKGDKFQFERVGYFMLDENSTKEKLIFNKTIGLVDSWAKMQKNKN